MPGLKNKNGDLLLKQLYVFQVNYPPTQSDGMGFTLHYYEKIGFELNPPKLGERYYVLTNAKLDRYPFSTSIVTTLPDKNGVFKTTYSTYRVEYI